MALHTAGILTADPREAKPPPGSTLDPSHPLARNVLGLWLCNEGGGGRIADIGPYGVHCFAPTTAGQKFAAQGDATGFLTNNTNGAQWTSRYEPNILRTTDFTVEARVFFQSTFAASAAPFWFGAQGSNFLGFQFRMTSSTACTMFASGTGSIAVTGLDTTKTLHLTYAYRVGDQRAYANGRLLNSAAPTGLQTWSGNPGTMSIGRGGSSGTTGNYYIDFITVFNRALTGAEVLDRYRRPYALVARQRAVPRPYVISTTPDAYPAALFHALM